MWGKDAFGPYIAADPSPDGGKELRVTRRRLVAHALLGAAGLVALGSARVARGATAVVRGVAVRNGGAPFAGDRRLFATVSPRSGGARGLAIIEASASRDLDAVLEVVSRNGVGARVLSREPVTLAAGLNAISWQPAPSAAPGSYILRLRPFSRDGSPAQVLAQAVVRVLDVEATFRRRSALPGEPVVLNVQSDADRLRLSLLRCGPETEPTHGNAEMKGLPVAEPREIALSRRRGEVTGVYVDVPVDASSGLYAARLESDAGHLGFAPIVVRPPIPQHRVAVVLSTTTWQAYNFYDRNGDGFGDTWYSLWAQRRIDLTRPHLRRGVPYRFRSYDVGFLHWLASRAHSVDMYADEDLEAFPSPSDLRAAYDLVVFPGHTEYVTSKLYDIVTGYRDLGGRLLFLSANNFFRQVVRSGDRARLVGEWRDRGRPESALLGVQYVSNDSGQRQQPFTVVGAETAPWAFAGTGLRNGSQFGRYGIEVDATTSLSPPGTQVLARIPDLFGPGRSAEMAYYETEAGARVFSAGALNFGGTIMLWPEVGLLLDNVWARLTSDVPPA
jgi:hypothetical protein